MKATSHISEMDTWPKVIRSYILDTYGSITSIEIMSGLSRNIVRKVNTPSKSVVLKKSVHPAELLFYQHVAPQLESLDISTPEVEFLFQSSTHYWLILEHIPLPLPPTRWNSDDDVLSLLYRLHNSTQISGHEMIFKPAWSDTMTEFARRGGYRFAELIAQAFVDLGGRGPLLDAGCGTGLVADHLPESIVVEGGGFLPRNA